MEKQKNKLPRAYRISDPAAFVSGRSERRTNFADQARQAKGLPPIDEATRKRNRERNERYRQGVIERAIKAALAAQHEGKQERTPHAETPPRVLFLDDSSRPEIEN